MTDFECEIKKWSLERLCLKFDWLQKLFLEGNFPNEELGKMKQEMIVLERKINNVLKEQRGERNGF